MRGLCVFAWATCFVAVAPALAVETNERPSPLSAEVVAAWREAVRPVRLAGAEHGFLSGVSPRRGGQGRGSANFRVRTSVEGRRTRQSCRHPNIHSVCYSATRM